MKEIEFTTCKLVFDYGTTREQVEQLLNKHTTDWSIATFNPDQQVGCNRLSFAVVDVPEAVMQRLNTERVVKIIDPMTSFYRKPSCAECCTPSG